jgi:putative membrane protein
LSAVSPLVRSGLAIVGLGVAIAVGWNALRGADLPPLSGSWCIPVVALLQIVQQFGCGWAWWNLVEAPRPSCWSFFRTRWVRASFATLVPVGGAGAAMIAVRLAMRAGLSLDIAVASLMLDATIEMISQIIFMALGLALLLAAAPQLQVAEWAAATLLFAVLAAAAFIAVQRTGGMKLIEFVIAKLASRWPRFMPLAEARLHDRLMHLHRHRRAASVSGLMHFGAWMLGAAEIWLILFAFGQPASLTKCVIVESLAMVGRSAGFFIPGALGTQEIALLLVGKLVGLTPETAILIAIVKRLRDVLVGVPGLVVWVGVEGFRARLPRFLGGDLKPVVVPQCPTKIAYREGDRI